MASAHSVPYYQPHPHLPPIQSYPGQQPPQTSQPYMPTQYRPELSRYQSTPASAQPPDRYNHHITPQHNMSGLPPASMLPQPNGPNQPLQHFSTPSSSAQPYQQRLAPAPPRPNLTPIGTTFTQAEDRPPVWSSAEQMPNMAAENGRDPSRTHVVGSQGRRGILPSAPGRAQVMPNGMNGPPKGNAIPAKDADGKFPCPNCNKTYLHAKHLKRHMLRHTGDRPYMCVLCNDTFSRSDILKRHFQKCSVRRGNPTGASHLSNPAAHLKKSAAAQAKAQADSPNSSGTPTTTSLTSAPFTSSALSAGPIPPANSTFNDGSQMQYGIPNNQSGDLQRAHPNQSMQSSAPQSAMAPHANGSWPIQAPRGNQIMYHSNPATPDHFSMQHGNVEDKRAALSGPHQSMGGDEWNQMFQAGGNENYMNPIFPAYDQGHHEVKNEAPEGGSNGYYISSASLGADGTLGPPLWQHDGSRGDPIATQSGSVD